MSANTFGTLFKITTFGESHGPAIGVIIDGCPAGLDINIEFIASELRRRKPGQSHITTQRKEEEAFDILSGVFEGKTTGTPICMVIKNQDQKSKDYSHIADKFRPSHADYTYSEKYGVRDFRGGGRSSARETAARVMAGAVAKILLDKFNIAINAYVSQVGNIKYDEAIEKVDHGQTESNVVRCPDMETASRMIRLIEETKKEGDTIGGKITCVIDGVAAGLGQPVFDKLHAELAKAIMSINAVKGFEYGSGFGCITMKGSQHNDAFTNEDGVATTSNHSGGIQGGISNGMPIYFNAAFKPVATIMKDQTSVDIQGEAVVIKGKGRHDPCVVPRAVPIVEAMAALVIADQLLLAQTDRLDHILK